MPIPTTGSEARDARSRARSAMRATTASGPSSAGVAICSWCTIPRLRSTSAPFRLVPPKSIPTAKCAMENFIDVDGKGGELLRPLLGKIGRAWAAHAVLLTSDALDEIGRAHV